MFNIKISTLVVLSMCILTGIFLSASVAKANTSKTISITFDINPSSLSVSKAPLKYNKEFAFSMNADDGVKDSYTIFYKALNGGRIADSDIFSKGAYFTDGAGNKIPFRGDFQLSEMSPNITDTFVNIRNIGNTGYVDWAEATEVSEKGWGITNHGWSQNGFPDPIDRIFPYPAPHNPSTIDYDYEISQNQDAIELNVGVRPIIFGAPDADPGYEPFIFTDHGLFAQFKSFNNTRYSSFGVDINQILDLSSYTILGYVFIPFEDTVSDLINYVDGISESSTNGANHWGRLTMHRFYETEGQNGLGYQSLKQFIEHIESEYGHTGADNGWIASSQEVYEYLYAEENLTIGESIVGNTLTLDLDFGNYPEQFKFQSISLLIDSNAEIVSVTSSDIGSNISFNPETGLINADFRFSNNDAFVEDAIELVELVEETKNQNDYNEADAYVSAMDPGDVKTSLRTRLDNVELFAREWYITFGTSTTLSRGDIWNSVNTSAVVTNKTLNEASGVASSLLYNTVSPFAGIASNGKTPEPSGSGIYDDNIVKAGGFTSASQASYKISNLEEGKVYDIELFASNSFPGTSNFSVVGDQASDIQSLNIFGNTNNTVIFYRVKPSESNDIQVNIAPNGRMGVLHLTERPEVSTPLASSPSGTYNTTQNINLSSTYSDYIKYSTSSLPDTCDDGLLYNDVISISSSETLYVRACDDEGNSATATFSYVIDSVPSNVTINQKSGTNDPSNVDAVFTVVFDNAVLAGTFTKTDISTVGSTATGIDISSITEIEPNDGTTFEVVITTTGDGIVVASVLPDGIADSLGNTNNASTSDDNSITIDTSSNDTDGDGILDSAENSGFNGGDGNGDNILDSAQQEVSTTLNSVTGDYSTLEATGDCSIITENEFIAEGSLIVSDSTSEYPLGLVDFQVECGVPGQSSDIVIYYSQEYDTSGWSYKKFNSSGNAYSDITDLVTFGTHTYTTGPETGNTVTTISFTVTDGDPRTDEDATADGIINDPSGPATSTPLVVKTNTRRSSKKLSFDEILKIFGPKDSATDDTIQDEKKPNCSISYSRLIRKGISGADVKQVQTCLNSIGYASGPEDGIYGPLTFIGVTLYQTYMKLKYIDGIVGPETSASLNLLSR